MRAATATVGTSSSAPAVQAHLTAGHPAGVLEVGGRDLRDVAALVLLAGICASRGDTPTEGQIRVDAKAAFRYADAWLAERTR